MKKLLQLILPILASFAHPALYSQDKLPEFGKPDMAELQLQYCPFDQDASAMNLLKTEDTRTDVDGIAFRLNFKLKTTEERRVRIKIFNETGFKYASIIIPYSLESHTVKITNVEAYILTIS